MAKIDGIHIGDIPGTSKNYYGGSVPSYYLLEDGSSVLIATYPALYVALGGSSSPFGSSDGFTAHFNLPDSRRRVQIGSGGIQVSGPATTVGSTGGEETHTLSTPEMPSHIHTLGNHTHAQNFSNNFDSITSIAGTSGQGNGQFNAGISTNGPSTNNSDSTGGGSSHNNMQPSLVVTKIVKY